MIANVQPPSPGRGPRVLGRALRLVWEASPRWTVGNALVLLAEGAVPLLVLWCVKLLVDEVAMGIAAGALGTNRVLLLVGAILALALLEAVLASLAAFAREALGLLVADHVQDELHEKAVAVDLAYYADPAYHDTLHRAQLEAPYQPAAVLNGLARLGRGAVLLGGTAVLVGSFHWSVALVLLAAGAPGALARLGYARVLRRWQLAQTGRERRVQYLHWLLSSERHAEEVRLFDLGSVLAWRSRRLRKGLREERLALSRRRALVDVATQAVVALLVFGCFGWMAVGAVEGAITVGSLVMYFQAFQRGRGAAAEMIASLGGLYERSLVLSQFYDFVALPTPAPRPAAALARQGGELAVEGVTFHYPRRPESALRDVTLTLRRGEVTAIVGASGSGKSTLVRLLCGLYTPARGRVLLDGIDICEVDPVDLRRKLAVVPQEFGRYDFPARDNIWFGDVALPEDSLAIAQAARDAGIAGVVEGLPEGYETPLGRLFEGGRELSAGQWQKVAVARCLLRARGIVILDEPTSNLDPRSEAVVLDRLLRDRAGRTVVLVSHRLSAARRADRVHVLDDGRVAESGSHAALLARGGAYARLFEQQARPYA